MSKVNGSTTFSVDAFVKFAEKLNEAGKGETAIKLGSHELHIVGKHNWSNTLLRTRTQFANALSDAYGANNAAVIKCKSLLLEAKMAKKPLGARTILDMTKLCQSAMEQNYVKGLAKLLKSTSERVDDKVPRELDDQFGAASFYGDIKDAVHKSITQTLLEKSRKTVLNACGSDEEFDKLVQQTAKRVVEDLKDLMDIAKSDSKGRTVDSSKSTTRFIRLAYAAKSVSRKVGVSFRLLNCVLDMEDRSPDVFKDDAKLTNEILRRIGEKPIDKPTADDLGKAAAQFCEKMGDMTKILRSLNGEKIRAICEDAKIKCDDELQSAVANDLRKEAVRCGSAVFDQNRLKVAIARSRVGMLINKTYGKPPTGSNVGQTEKLTRALFDAKMKAMLENLSAEATENLMAGDGIEMELEKVMMKCGELTKDFMKNITESFDKKAAGFWDKIASDYNEKIDPRPTVKLGSYTFEKLMNLFLGGQGIVDAKKFDDTINKQFAVLEEVKNDLDSSKTFTTREKLIVLKAQCQRKNPLGNHVILDAAHLLSSGKLVELTQALPQTDNPAETVRVGFLEKFGKEINDPLVQDAKKGKRFHAEWGSTDELLYMVETVLSIQLDRDPKFIDVIKNIGKNFNLDSYFGKERAKFDEKHVEWASRYQSFQSGFEIFLKSLSSATEM